MDIVPAVGQPVDMAAQGGYAPVGSAGAETGHDDRDLHHRPAVSALTGVSRGDPFSAGTAAPWSVGAGWPGETVRVPYFHIRPHGAMDMPPLWKSAKTADSHKGFGRLRFPHSHSDPSPISCPLFLNMPSPIGTTMGATCTRASPTVRRYRIRCQLALALGEASVWLPFGSEGKIISIVTDVPDRPWTVEYRPRRILAIRLQALGDVVVTLPYLQALRRALGCAEIDLLTRREVADVPANVVLFRRVYRIGGGRRFRGQLLSALLLQPLLLVNKYDVVLDLQNNRLSRLVRRSLRSTAWSSFDRFSPLPAGERTRRTIEDAGFPLPRVTAGLDLKEGNRGLQILKHAGGAVDRELVVLSPEGASPTRNWPLDHYADFARLWCARRPAQFVILGLPWLKAKAAALQAQLGNDLVNLVGQTTASQALAIVQAAQLVISEDCGLMHMAWVSGVPTLALFGSTRHDWSAPLGPHSRCLHSGDLPRGACMDASCRFGDVHCLTRYTPEFVVEQAEELVQISRHAERTITPAFPASV